MCVVRHGSFVSAPKQRKKRETTDMWVRLGYAAWLYGWMLIKFPLKDNINRCFYITVFMTLSF